MAGPGQGRMFLQCFLRFDGDDTMENHESITAKLCSFVRAHHSIHERKKIFDDYLACDLMGIDEYREIRGMIASGACEMCDHGGSCPYRDEIAQTVQQLAPIPLSREAFIS